MSAEKIVTAIPSLSGFDMLDGVRSQVVLDEALDGTLNSAIKGPHREIPMPSHDAVLAFESAMQTSHYATPAGLDSPVGPVSHSQEVDFTNALAMNDTSVFTDGMHVTQDAVRLPSPDTLIADGVRQMQGGVDAVEPSWMEVVAPTEKDALQRGLDSLDNLFYSASSDALSQKTLLQLQFAMEEISVYKEIGVQISQKSASNIETVLKQTE